MKRFLVLALSVFIAGLVLGSNAQAVTVDGVFKFKCPGIKGTHGGTLDTTDRIFTPDVTSKLQTNKKASKNVEQVFLSADCVVTQVQKAACDPATETLDPFTNTCMQQPPSVAVCDALGQVFDAFVPDGLTPPGFVDACVADAVACSSGFGVDPATTCVDAPTANSCISLGLTIDTSGPTDVCN